MAQSRGLGDTIEKVTTFLGIKQLVEKLNPDCGCPYRRDYLNEKVPYNFESYKRILKNKL
jgi:hypothetical protein